MVVRFFDAVLARQVEAAAVLGRQVQRLRFWFRKTLYCIRDLATNRGGSGIAKLILRRIEAAVVLHNGPCDALQAAEEAVDVLHNGLGDALQAAEVAVVLAQQMTNSTSS